MTQAQQAPLRFLGTWKLTRAVGNFSPWEVTPASGIASFTEESGGIRHNFDGADSSGKAMHESWLCPTDGCWVPTDKSAAAFIDNDEASIQVCEDGSLELSLKQAGNQTGMISSTISADGQTMTTNWTYRGAYDDGADPRQWKPKVTATLARE